MVKYLAILVSALMCSCASPRVAPRFTQPSTVPIQKWTDSASKHVMSAKKKSADIANAEKDPALKLQIASLTVDLDNAIGDLITVEAARQKLDAQLQAQTTKANKLAGDYNKAAAKIKAQSKIISQVNSHWGLGAFVYGVQVLVHHLVILAVCIIAFLALVWVLGLVFPLFGAGVKVASLFIVSAINRIRNR